MHEWRDHELLRRALGVFGLESLAESEEAPAEVVALAEQRVEARARQRLRGGRPPARRDRGGRLGRARRGRRVPARPAPMTLTREFVYGRNAVRELLPRAAAGARDLGRRSARPRRSRGSTPARVRRSSPSACSPRRRARATTRASSPGASPSATPTPTSSPRRTRRCSSASTRSPIRTTSGRSRAAPRARARPPSSSRRTAPRA